MRRDCTRLAVVGRLELTLTQSHLSLPDWSLCGARRQYASGPAGMTGDARGTPPGAWRVPTGDRGSGGGIPGGGPELPSRHPRAAKVVEYAARELGDRVTTELTRYQVEARSDPIPARATWAISSAPHAQPSRPPPPVWDCLSSPAAPPYSASRHHSFPPERVSQHWWTQRVSPITPAAGHRRPRAAGFLAAAAAGPRACPSRTWGVLRPRSTRTIVMRSSAPSPFAPRPLDRRQAVGVG